MADDQPAAEPESPKRENADRKPLQSKSQQKPDRMKRGDTPPANSEELPAARAVGQTAAVGNGGSFGAGRAGPTRSVTHSVERYGIVIDPIGFPNREAGVTVKWAAGEAAGTLTAQSARPAIRDAFNFQRRCRRRLQKLEQKKAFILAKVRRDVA